MPYSQEVKEAAYKLDPECWVSYSGKPKEFKQAMELRRTAALQRAEKELAPAEQPEQAACLLTGTGVQVASLLAQRGAIHLETLGLKHSRGGVSARVKKAHGWKGNGERILQQLEDYIEQLTGVQLHKRYTERRG